MIIINITHSQVILNAPNVIKIGAGAGIEAALLADAIEALNSYFIVTIIISIFIAVIMITMQHKFIF